MKLYDEYLTDEELMNLIDEVENFEMVEAPEYLTENIMNAVENSKEKSNNTIPMSRVKDSEIEAQKKPPRNKKQELINYGFKVMLSAVASIAILLAVPVTQSDVAQRQQEPSKVVSVEKKQTKPISKALNSFNKKTNEVVEYLNDSTTIFSNKGGNRNDKKKEK